MEFAKFLDNCNSVFIHARRGDMLSANGWCYKYGYFRRAVKHIKKNVKDPVFVFFTNTGSIEWCKENAKIKGEKQHTQKPSSCLLLARSGQLPHPYDQLQTW